MSIDAHAAAPPADAGGSHDHGHHEAGFLGKYVFSRDHKVIGIQFLFSSLLFLVLGGGLAMLVRWQIANPDRPIPLLGRTLFPNSGGAPSPEFYAMTFSMHATIMIFFVVIPILTGAFGNFLIPLQIGARDMAFPTMNMLSYWTMVPGFVLVVCSFFVAGGAGAAGWTSYPTLAGPGSGTGQTLWYLALLCVGVSSLLGSMNYITTIVKLRCPGMTFFRMPMATWALFITAILQAFALPVLTAALIFGLLDRVAGTNFFIPPALEVQNRAAVPGGGQPLLWQHLFWFYSHPAVYIMILPGMGMVSDIIATFARKPLFGYRPMVYSVAGIAGLGFVVWGHHMFQSGMNPALGATFMVSTMLIALPSAVKVFNWLATLWEANIRYTAAMLFGIGFVSLFIIGGLSGIFMAATPVDIYIHDTYFIVAHIHYVLFTGSLFAAFGAVYYWFPKMFGRKMDELWGKIHFVLTFLFANLTFYPMHILGVGGMPRRYMNYGTYASFAPFEGLNKFITAMAFMLGLVQLFFFVNFFKSLFRGEKAETNPWQSNSLEWSAASPPPHGNWGETLPTVYRAPYEYASPLVGEDWLPQTRKLEEGGPAGTPATQPAH